VHGDALLEPGPERPPAEAPADVKRFAVLPTRDAVLLPGAVNELQVGRPGSVAALRHAAEHDEPVLIVLQRKARVDEPGPADLHEVGTLARVTDAERMSADAACVGVHGVQRVRIATLERSGDALFAQVEELAWGPVEPSLPEVLAETLPFLVDGLRALFSARTFSALHVESVVERLSALSVVAPLDAAELQSVLERADLQPIVETLESLRNSWLVRFLRWIRR
jgi:ATP-dependent Lon protease